MRIYIAGPMTGLPDWNYPAFHDAAAAWRNAGWEVVNPAEAFDGATDRPYTEYVEHDLELLQRVDAVALLPGWNGPNARGSVWEACIARKLFKIAVYDATKPAPPEELIYRRVVPITRGRDGVLRRHAVQMDLFENSYGG